MIYQQWFTKIKQLVLSKDVFVLMLYMLVGMIVQATNIFSDSLIGVGGDTINTGYAVKSYMGAALRDGEFPFWNQYSYGGFPFFAGTDPALFYLPNLIFVVLPPVIAFKLSYLLHAAFGAFFMYLFLSVLNLQRVAAIVGGLLFGYMGVVVIRYGHIHLHNTAAWLPLIFFLVEKYLRSRNLKYVVFTAFAFVMSFMAGFIQLFVYYYIVIGAYLFLHGIRNYIVERKIPWMYLRDLSMMFGIPILLLSVYFLSLLEVSKFGIRGLNNRLTFEAFSTLSLNPLEIFTFIFPFLYTPPSGLSVAAHNVVEIMGYISIPALYFALLGVFAGIKERLTVQYFFLLALIALVLAMGANTPLHRVLYHLPVIGQFRIPPRWIIFTEFGLIVLCAYGLDYAFKRSGQIVGSRLLEIRALKYFAASVATCLLLIWSIKVIARATSQDPFRAAISTQYSGLETASILGYVFIVTTIIVIFFLHIGLLRNRVFYISIALLFAGEIYVFNRQAYAIYGTQKLPETTVLTDFLKPRIGQDRICNFYEAAYGIQSSSNLLFQIPSLNGYSSLVSKDVVDYYKDMNYMHAFFNTDLLSSQNRAIDIMSGKFIITPKGVNPAKIGGIQYSGVINEKLRKNQRIAFQIQSSFDFDQLHMISSMADSTGVPQGLPVGYAIVTDSRNVTKQFVIRAGAHTAEWAYDSPALAQSIRHKRAEIATSSDTNMGFQAHAYVGKLQFSAPRKIVKVEIFFTNEVAHLDLFRIGLLNTHTGENLGLERADELSDKFLNIYATPGAAILENKKSLPRVWSVRHLRNAQSKIEIFDAINSGVLAQELFNPLKTAFVLAEDNHGLKPDGYSGKLKYFDADYSKNNSVIINAEIVGTGHAFVVMNDRFFPGWTAKIDGTATKIFRTNGIMRGILVPVGKHQIVMSYMPTFFKRGAIISSIGLVFCIILLWFANRRTK